MTLSEIIKSRGNVEHQKYADYNDMIDEVYVNERKIVKTQLKQLDGLIKKEPDVFGMAFKRSLLNHINERKRQEE